MTALEFSPAMMFLGREPRLPIDLLVGRPPDNIEIPFSNYTEYVDKLRCKMQQIHELASQKLLQASNCQKRNYDFRQHRIDYEPGDPVFVRNETPKKGYSPKLQPRWTGVALTWYWVKFLILFMKYNFPQSHVI